MFIRLSDVKSNVSMILSVREIIAAKEYIPNGVSIEFANTVVMTRPIDETEGKTHNYFVSETLSEVEDRIRDALDYL